MNEELVTINNNATNQEHKEIDSNFMQFGLWSSALGALVLSMLVFEQRPQTQGQRPVKQLSINSELLPHSMLDDALHLQRVWHSKKSCGAQAKRSAFGIRGEGYAIALCIRIRKSRLHV